MDYFTYTVPTVSNTNERRPWTARTCSSAASRIAA